MAIEYRDERKRWEAESPRPAERPMLRHLGFVWDRLTRAWYAPDDDIALQGMEMEAGG